MDRNRRFELRQRQPDDQQSPGRIVGFGAWRPADDLVLSCRLAPPTLQNTVSFDSFVAQLDEHELLVWVDQDATRDDSDEFPASDVTSAAPRCHPAGVTW